MVIQEQFTEDHGIYVPQRRPRHRDEEYDETGFNFLIQMQREHFWYRGRHKLLVFSQSSPVVEPNAISTPGIGHV